MRIQQSGWEMKRDLDRIPWCSAILTAVNVIVFLACQFYGNVLYAQGSFSILYLIRNGEYYRLVTAMFLHADISHLANNMILLYFGGEIVEKTIGKVRYLILFSFPAYAEISFPLYMNFPQEAFTNPSERAVPFLD